MIKVIHVWNTGGIGALLSRYLDRYYNYESINVVRKGHDPFSLANEKSIIWDHRASIWLLRCALKCRSFDIIHLHGGIQWLPYFRLIYPNKKIVLHLHGSKIRNKWNEYNLDKADMIIVSTPDLLKGSPENTVYLPNIVDEDLINSIISDKDLRVSKNAFHVNRYAFDVAFEYATMYKLNIVIHDRDETPLNHKEFLEMMNLHSFYIDVKRGFPYMKNENEEILRALSLTGLEALYMGLKVIRWDGKMLDEFPKYHKSVFVCELLNNIYNCLWENDLNE